MCDAVEVMAQQYTWGLHMQPVCLQPGGHVVAAPPPHPHGQVLWPYRGGQHALYHSIDLFVHVASSPNQDPLHVFKWDGGGLWP